MHVEITTTFKYNLNIVVNQDSSDLSQQDSGLGHTSEPDQEKLREHSKQPKVLTRLKTPKNPVIHGMH